MDIDIVVESTGLWTKRPDAEGHLKAGAQKVIISAPSDDSVKTFIVGTNDQECGGEDIISNGSCTTNCLVPIVQVLMQSGIGVEEGFMTTVHSYTADQLLVDGPHSKDPRRGRGAGVNIVPSSSGAAQAVTQVYKHLEGKLTGMAFRVPTSNGSVVDFNVRTSRDSSLEEINTAMKEASQSYLKTILAYTEDQVVSSDFIHDSHSSIYDATASMEIGSRFFKLISWYDNEWGYSNRLVDLLATVISKNNG